MDLPELSDLNDIQYMTEEADYGKSLQIAAMGRLDGQIYRYLVAIIPIESKNQLIKALIDSEQVEIEPPSEIGDPIDTFMI